MPKNRLDTFSRVYRSNWGTVYLEIDGVIVYTIYEPDAGLLGEIQRDWYVVDDCERYGDIYARKPAPVSV